MVKSNTQIQSKTETDSKIRKRCWIKMVKDVGRVTVVIRRDSLGRYAAGKRHLKNSDDLSSDFAKNK